MSTISCQRSIYINQLLTFAICFTLNSFILAYDGCSVCLWTANNHSNTKCYELITDIRIQNDLRELFELFQKIHSNKIGLYTHFFDYAFKNYWHEQCYEQIDRKITKI